jgi:hypothetical protein
MADEKILHTRIVLKNDDLSTWNSSSLILKKGEIALAKVESAADGEYSTPTYLMKVGDGNSTFANLKWVAAAAADVYSWAKLENPTIEQLPGNLKTAIQNLQSAVGEGGSVADSINAAIGALDVTDTAVEMQFVTAVSETDGKISVSRRALAASDIPTLAISKIDGLQAALDAKVAKADFETFKSSNTEAIADAKAAGTAASTALGEYKTANDAAVKANTDAIAAINHAETGILKQAKSYADGLAGNYDAAGAAAAVQGNLDTEVLRAKAAEEANAAAAAEADRKAVAAQGEVDALEEYVGVIPEASEATTLVAYIQEKTAGIATEGAMTELAGRVTTVEGKVATIEGDYLTSADKQALQTQIDTIMSNPDAEGAINSINEFTQYVKDHGEIAEGFRTDINKNKDDIAAEVKRAGEAESALSGRLDTLEAINHEAYIAADTALKNELNGEIAKKVTQADYDVKVKALEDADAALSGRIKDLEDNKASYATTGQVATAKSEAIAEATTLAGTAETNAKGYADGLIAALDSSIEATAGSVLTGITVTDGKITAKNEVALAAIATTGSTDDLVQGSKVLVFDCGSAS